MSGRTVHGPFMSLGHKNLILLLEMRSCNEHEKMPK